MMLGVKIAFAIQVGLQLNALLANSFLINAPKCFVKRNTKFTNLYQTQANDVRNAENHLLQKKKMSGIIK